MKIGIIGAMDVEVASLKEKMVISRTETYANMTFCEGTLGKTSVVIVKSGICKVNAAMCVQLLVDHFEVTHIINTGVAGSLDNAINIGDIVVSTDAQYHDVNATVFGYQKGEVPQMGIVAFPADPGLRAAAVRAVGHAAPDVAVFEGQVLSGDQFISTRARKEELMRDFHGKCTEMEGAAIAHASYVNGTPFLIIRTMSDSADDNADTAYDNFIEAAARQSASIVLKMLELAEEEN